MEAVQMENNSVEAGAPDLSVDMGKAAPVEANQEVSPTAKAPEAVGAETTESAEAVQAEQEGEVEKTEENTVLPPAKEEEVEEN
ncbi:Hypothetical Protein FCC1311_049882 [Hondaea fermentalgiana]|uniref:Uncharacterized protein n=1 Tax=Hondaea fermentalgiana TaxID=2315210 RepID=A0A2R5GCQ5_9STRA|nr:Hypothetical Protein FCC1311_049882 [Hondaea fermentalgiana]|eukprot:GBG28767.1 Hypothetical Protein FCC1311_049882 [Hondaea fermentalgiana]